MIFISNHFQDVDKILAEAAMQSNKNDKSVADNGETIDGNEAGDDLAVPTQKEIGGTDTRVHSPGPKNDISPQTIRLEDTQPVTVLVTGANNGVVPGLQTAS